MRRPRFVPAVCLLLAALALALPAGALAGGSAGNQQYTDPFSATAPTSQSAPAQSATTTAPTTSATPTPTATESATPPPTSPSSGAPPTSAPAARTLPYTGYAVWLGAGFGATLLAAGLVLRVRTREER